MTYNTTSNATAVVRDLARQAGVTLTSNGREILSLLLQSEGTWDGSAPITDLAWLQTKLAETPSYVDTAPASTSATPDTSGMNRTQRAMATIAATKSTDGRAAEAAKVVAKWGNPWKSGNRTHQGFVTNADPNLAQRLRGEAAL